MNTCSLMLDHMLFSLWGFYTGYHRLDGLNSRNIFSYSSGGWKSKIKGLAGLVSGETPLPDLQTDAYTVFICVWVPPVPPLLPVPAAVLLHEGPPLWPFQVLMPSNRLYLQTQSHWGLGLQHIDLGDTIQFIMHA